MGAFGAALIARERFSEGYETTMLSFDDIVNLQFETSMAKCKGCTNNCRLTINKFSGGRQYISGNRCERGIGKQKNANGIPNLLTISSKGSLITKSFLPTRQKRDCGHSKSAQYVRKLPLLGYLFTKLGYRVILSPLSNRKFMSLALNPFPANPNAILQN